MDKYGNVRIKIHINLPDLMIQSAGFTRFNRTKEEGAKFLAEVRELNPGIDFEGWFVVPPEML